MDDSHDDDDGQAEQQQRGQNLADDVDNGGLLDRQRQNDDKEDRGEQDGRDAADVGGDTQFIGCRGGTRDGDERADAQQADRDEDLADGCAQTVEHGIGAAHAEQSETAHQGQTAVTDEEHEKTGKPAAAGFHADVRGEHSVARAEEHGEEGETHYDHVADAKAFFCFQIHSLLSSLLKQAYLALTFFRISESGKFYGVMKIFNELQKPNDSVGQLVRPVEKKYIEKKQNS